MDLHLASLRAACVQDPALPLPDQDALGVPHGARYSDVFVRLHKRRACSAGKTNDLRGGRPYTFLGNEISALDLLLKVNPCVREVRCYYPLMLARTAEKRGPSVPRIILAERMLTVLPSSAPERWHLHAVFTDENRMKVAAEQLSSIDTVSFEFISLTELRAIEVRNAAQCYQWLLGLDIRTLKSQAHDFSIELKGRYRRALAQGLSLDRFMASLASVVSCDRDRAYCLLGTAIVYGFINVDHAVVLSTSRPLRLCEKEFP